MTLTIPNSQAWKPRMKISQSNIAIFKIPANGDGLVWHLLNMALERPFWDARVVTLVTVFCKSTQILAYDKHHWSAALLCIQILIKQVIEQAAENFGWQINEAKAKLMAAPSVACYSPIQTFWRHSGLRLSRVKGQRQEQHESSDARKKYRTTGLT